MAKCVGADRDIMVASTAPCKPRNQYSNSHEGCLKWESLNFFLIFLNKLYPRSIWITVEPSTWHILTFFSVCEEVFSIWLVGEPEASCPTLKVFFYPNREPFLGFVVANFGHGPQWTILSTTCHNCIIWCIMGCFFFHLKQLIEIMPSLSTAACRWRLFRWCWKEESVFIFRVVKYTDLELLIKRSLAQLQKGGCVRLCSNRDLEMCTQNVIRVWVVGLFASQATVNQI